MAGIPFIKDALVNFFKAPVTKKYPYEKTHVPEGYRGKIKFHPEFCVACGMCIRVCAPQCITKTTKNIEGGQEITLTFDMGSCTYCGMCADFCMKKAIELTKEYSIIATADDKSQLIVEGTFIKKLPPKPPVKPSDPQPPKADKA
ncbi:4Fe-4S dicluster domain-containing protein [Clostridium thermarum]|uniref:4Fe-4S dicluster domain-containing protein n=1 Tax=Clostridium thermarum TaxID=1716543 RepID=UPI0013D584A5|nr:4Fe-4S dicluster domain-containing protein [Clostridium thermarum]